MRTLKNDLYSRLILVLTAVVGVGLTVGLLVLMYLQQTLIQRAGEALALAATNTASRLDRVLVERAGDSQMMSRAFTGRLDQPEFLSAYLTWMSQAYPVYQWLGVLNPDGTVLATNASEWRLQNRAKTEWFTRASTESGVLLLEAKTYPEANGQVAVGFATAIRERGVLQGLVVSFVTLRLLEESYLNLRQAVQDVGHLQTGIEYVVVDRHGVALIDSLLYQEGQAVLAALPSVQRARQHDTPGYVEEQSLRRPVQLITGYARTTGYGNETTSQWTVLVRASRDEVIQPIRRIMGMVALGGLVVMAPLLGLLIWMLLRLRREMLKVHESEEALRQAHGILEQRIAERTQEVVQKQQQLVQTAKLASLGQLSAGIAHELNNPLNNISLFVGNALDEINEGLKGRQLQDPLREKLKSALQQIRRAAEIIQQLRTFARSAGTHMGPVQLADVVHAALALLAEQFRLNSITVTINIADPRARVLGNTLQLEQVLVNLLSNASDALSRSSVKQVTISVHGERGYEIIRIQDTGAGILEKDLPHIFDPFYTTKEVGEGTGLGLSIVYGIIKDHGGQVRVESQPGRGTCFEIQLPSMADG